jgi:hypothetical protein
MFYDEDVLDEEVLLEWGKKVSKKYVSKELSEQIHKRAESFLTWLKEAEEESEDDSDEDVELEFDERAKISTIKEKVNFDIGQLMIKVRKFRLVKTSLIGLVIRTIADLKFTVVYIVSFVCVA